MTAATPPYIVVVCGSMEEPEQLLDAALRELRPGRAVYCPTPQPPLSVGHQTTRQRALIKVADEVVAVRLPDGSHGAVAAAEIRFARELDVPVREVDGR